MNKAKVSRSSVSFLSLYTYASPSTLLLAFVGVFCGVTTGLLWPFLFIKVGDAYSAMQDPLAGAAEFYNSIVVLSHWMVAMGFVALATGYVGVLCSVAAGTRVANEFRKRYLKSILNQNMQWIDKHNPLTLPSQMHSDCSKIELAVGEKLLTFCNVASFLVSGMSNSLLYCPQLAVAALIPSPFVFLGMILVGCTMTKREMRKQEAYAEAGSIAEESITEYKTVAAHCAEESRISTYTQRLDASRAVMTRLGLTFGLGWGLISCMWFIITSIVFWYGGVLVNESAKGWIRDNKIGVREEIIVFLTIGATFLYLGNLVPSVQAIADGKIAGFRAMKIIRKTHYLKNGVEKPEIKGKIQFENVFFQYNTGKGVPVLKGLSFIAEAGSVTALVGESGAGKSTVAQLIERFYDPLVGRVLIDGRDLRELDIEYWRKHIGLVSQEPILFNLSIYDNIALGRKDASPEDVMTAARLSSALSFIQTMDQSFETEVGTKGRLLSGGQKQKIAIARALVRKPAILILDEATSSLDNRSESEVQQALDRLLSEKQFTTIVIAQRLSTIKSADNIIVLSGGRKVEEGSHESLLSSNGLYNSLIRAQNTGPEVLAESHIFKATETGVVSEYVSEDRKKIRNGSVSLRMLKMNSKNSFWLLLGCVSAVGAGLNYPVYGYSMSKEIDYTVLRHGDDMVWHCKRLAIIVALISMSALFCTTVMSTSLGRVTANITSALRTSAFKSILYQEAAFHDIKSNNPHSLTQALERDCEHVSTAGGPMLASVLMIASAILIGSYIGISHSLKLGLVVTALSPLLFFGLMRGYMLQIDGISHPAVESANTFLSDAVANIRTLHAYDIAPDLQKRYHEHLDRAYCSSRLNLHCSALSFGFSLMTLYIVSAVSFWYGAKLVRDEGLMYEDECIAIFAPYMGAMGMTVAAVFAPDLSAGSKAVKRLFGLIDYQSTFSAADQSGLKPVISGEIEFRNVTFAYPSKLQPALQGASFHVPAGSSLGITGASGSGKSTIAQLLLRFYDPNSGDILIDGIDLRCINLKYLRQAISIVNQEPVLFTGSIRENVVLGREGTKEEEVEKTLRLCQAMEFVGEHPAGLDREVGIRGSNLSGGQKQRIAIARALCRHSKILILDESTSALDTKTERKLQLTLSTAQEQRTCLIIAHRLNTIAGCDFIMVIDAGRIKEMGTHTELLGKEGSMYAAQLLQCEKRCKVN